MSLKIGIIGLPNVGKSTLFKALTRKEVLIENYPFATIDPNIGVVAVPDERLDKLAKFSNSQKTTPTIIEFVDIAGLVKNAHKGEGLGNQFLSHIREVDAIAHLIRKFSDTNIHHVEGSIDPRRDIDTIKIELIMSDFSILEKRIEAVKGKAQTGDKEAKQKLEAYEKIKQGLEAEKFVNEISLTNKELELIKDLNFITQKPIIHILNTKDQAFKLDKDFLSLDVKQELELSALTIQDRYDLGIKETGLDMLIKLAYQILNLITFLTTGPQETRAWTVSKGTKAPQSAGVIHTDFERKFIRAEVIKWQELLDCGSWAGAREKGRIRTEGKEYIIQDGDVVFFKI